MLHAREFCDRSSPQVGPRHRRSGRERRGGRCRDPRLRGPTLAAACARTPSTARAHPMGSHIPPVDAHPPKLSARHDFLLEVQGLVSVLAPKAPPPAVRRRAPATTGRTVLRCWAASDDAVSPLLVRVLTRSQGTGAGVEVDVYVVPRLLGRFVYRPRSSQSCWASSRTASLASHVCVCVCPVQMGHTSPQVIRSLNGTHTTLASHLDRDFGTVGLAQVMGGLSWPRSGRL